MPSGDEAPVEARLETFGPSVMPSHDAWPKLMGWWLTHARGANTPNWDIALACEIEGKAGLVLVEAKANVPELSEAGKRLDTDASPNSNENHMRIGGAIAEAQTALHEHLPGISISRDRHYQLSNRLAFGWKLANLGIPTVILYLGFIGDRGLAKPFLNEAHWNEVFAIHMAGVCPPSAIGTQLPVGPAGLWIMSRTRVVLEPSNPA